MYARVWWCKPEACSTPSCHGVLGHISELCLLQLTRHTLQERPQQAQQSASLRGSPSIRWAFIRLVSAGGHDVACERFMITASHHSRGKGAGRLLRRGLDLLGGLGHNLLALAAHAPEARDLRAACALVAAQARRNRVRVLFPHVPRARLPARPAPTEIQDCTFKHAAFHAHSRLQSTSASLPSHYISSSHIRLIRCLRVTREARCALPLKTDRAAAADGQVALCNRLLCQHTCLPSAQ